MLEPRTFPVAQSGRPGRLRFPDGTPSAPRCCGSAGASLAFANETFRHARASFTMAGLGPPLRTPETPSVGSTPDLAIPGGTTRSTCLPRAPHHAPCLLRARSAAPPSGELRGERPPRHRRLAARSEEGRFSPTSAINHGIETCTRMDGRLPIIVPKAETLDPMDPTGRARRARSGGRHLDGVRDQLRPILESPPGFHPDDGHRPFLVSSAIARAFRTAPHRRGVFDRERGSWTDL